MNNLYDTVAAVSDELKLMGRYDLVNELNGVCDELDRLESVLESAQKIIVEVRRKQYGRPY